MEGSWLPGTRSSSPNSAVASPTTLTGAPTSLSPATGTIRSTPGAALTSSGMMSSVTLIPSLAAASHLLYWRCLL